eukprot:2433851-Rhodomonas_salina.1
MAAALRQADPTIDWLYLEQVANPRCPTLPFVWAVCPVLAQLIWSMPGTDSGYAATSLTANNSTRAGLRYKHARYYLEIPRVEENTAKSIARNLILRVLCTSIVIFAFDLAVGPP